MLHSLSSSTDISKTKSNISNIHKAKLFFQRNIDNSLTVINPMASVKWL